MDRNYVSSFEQFLNLYKAQHPKTDDEQREGRALLWDKIPMISADPSPADDELKQPSYPYYKSV
ncbi:DUF3460 family protein [Caballeronia sp. LZ001]|uniref:DUF3460 family protein n=1 Tax=Caballeronia sp. LZ001 TaxID=3038553 RepID=UPI00285BB977|nr:DUF3460 family protein [Caballeronia sp. LZ001]MDR5806375.1 DUF3460 family protein [Caballeronia sp. LZ001]